MNTVKIKALSTNEAYKGRHFPTKALEAYKLTLAYLLPPLKVPPGKLAVKYVFGLSSKNSDADNCIKHFTDALCRKYNFDDRNIYRWEVEKQIVKKGEEFVAFELKSEDKPKQSL